MDNFIGFVIDPYTYKVARARKDGVVRGHGFAGSKPAAWAFLAGAVGRGEMTFAQYADTADGEKHNLLVVARCRGRVP